MVTDITEQKRAEATLRESEARFKDLASFLPLSLFETDDQGNITFANTFAFESTGYTQEDIDKGLHMLQVIHPEDHDKAIEMSMQVMQGELTDGSEYLVQRKDGSTFHAYINTNPTIRDDKLVGLKGYIFDLTGQKEAERALRESESKFRDLFDLSPQAIALTEVKSGRLVDINNKLCELTKYPKEEIIGLNTTEVGFYLEADRRNFLKELQASGEVNGLEMEFKAKDNSILHTLMFARIIQIEGESFILTIFHDVTEQKRLEAQLQQSQKLEAMGTLAGGIAHDFNNILSPIILYTELVLEDISEKDHLRFSLEEVLRASLRAKDLTKQILTFSRQTEQERIPFKISPVVKEALKLLRSSLPSTIEIRQNIEAKVGVVLADPTQIHQILMNIGTNAANAMRERGGVLEVSLVDVDLHSDDTDHAVDLEPGQYIKLTVSDTGHGIEPAIMDKIFDPYFTTQEKGKGTGLGLSVVHGIVNTHGGHISAHSEPDKGTRFDVYLPLFDLADIKAETVSPEKLPKGNEHILLVDDEKPIVDVVQQMLERLGYQVTVRTSSIEALEAFSASMDKFDLVITDLTMPNMTGDKLAVELMNIRPDIPIILCTGFSENMSKERAEALGIKGFLMKPIVTSDLAKLIREVIDKR
jgi:PAS domain S-box-containing protein